jgi:hypothetical protein
MIVIADSASPAWPTGQPRNRVSRFRPCTLQISHLISRSVRVDTWPAAVRHTSGISAEHGIQRALLAGIGTTPCWRFDIPLASWTHLMSPDNGFLFRG